MLAWQLIGACSFDSTRNADWNPEGTCSDNGPFTASATNPPPFQLDPPTSTLIGPFSVCNRSFPPAPEKLSGPFTADTSASPEQFSSEIGPFSARAVIFPSTL
jgi:hypothetical protein